MFAFLLAAVMLHPVHETLSEVEWNEESHRLEVALRLDALDEQWLRQRAGANDSDSQWAIQDLQRTFRITDFRTSDDVKDAGAISVATGTKEIGAVTPDPTASYHWIGREEKGPYVWWYFEIEPVDHQRPRWIDVRLLWERNENHVNRILILGRKSRRALTLTTRRPKAPFGDSAHEQPPSTEPDR